MRWALTPDYDATSTGRRAALARWIASKQNPLTARVMVNRIWQHHFGEGIVRTPDNFGKMGERPTHPELLNDLGARFMQDGAPLPALASVAKQEGKYLGKMLKAKIAERPFKPFRYRDYGTMATIGRNAAVMQVDNFKLSGLPAWIIWGFVHIMFLTGFRNQVSVFITWVWTYLTYGMGSRIILRQEKDL